MLTKSSGTGNLKRLTDLNSYFVHKINPEPVLNEIINLACQFTDTKIAYLSFIDDTNVSIISSKGLDQNTYPAGSTYCSEIINNPENPLILPSINKTGKNNKTGKFFPDACFFAGFPVFSADDNCLGALCVIHDNPHKLNKMQMKSMSSLASLVTGFLKEHREKMVLEKRNENNNKYGKHLPLILEANPSMGLLEVDIKNNALLISENWSNLFGYNSEMPFSDWLANIHSEDQEKTKECLNELSTGRQKSCQMEYRVKSKDGKYLNILGNSAAFKNNSDKISKIVGVCIDISKQKKTEESLKNEVLKNAAIFKAAGDGLHILDSNGNLVQASDSFCSMLGYHCDEIIGLNILKWSTRLQNMEDYKNTLEQLLNKSEIYETQHRKKDGRIIDVEIHAITININNENHLFASARDITYRKILEKARIETEASLRATLDNLPHMIWLKDTQCRFRLINKKFLKMTGKKSMGEIIGKTDFDLWPSTLAEKYFEDDKKVMQLRSGIISEEKAIDNNRSIWVETYKAPIIDENNQVIGTVGYSYDITDRRQFEESLKLSSLVYDYSSEAIVVTDENNLIIDINPSFTEITGYKLEDIIGKDPKILGSGKHSKDFFKTMWGTLLKENKWQGEILDKKKTGEIYVKWANIFIIRDNDGKIFRHVGFFSDITEKKRMEDIIWNQANFDSLTGLPNRRLFYDRLREEIKRSRRTSKSFALMYIDLDNFKTINDYLGHHAGDTLLVMSAKRISSCLRESDTIARLGGDEFIAILSGQNDKLSLENIAQNILNSLCMPFILQGEERNISASIGISLYPDDGTSSEILIQNSDIAMYIAKNKGRNSFHFYQQ